MRILVTNDDGIDSPGIRALADMARPHGHEVVVAAPGWDASGASSSVTGVSQVGEVVTEARHWDGWDEGTVMAVDGTPALIVFYALHDRLGPRPDFVLSGINLGANTGRSILHSGTVGAAFTAYQQGLPALAVSSAVPDLAAPGTVHWDSAAHVGGVVLDWLIDEGHHAVLNCNVPNSPLDEVHGLRMAGLAEVGSAQTAVTEDHGSPVSVTLGGGDESGEVESDAALLQRGFASVSALRPVVIDETIDLARVVGTGLRPSEVPDADRERTAS